jgi:predicted NBD/HSP70 family sugar kinase
MTSQIFIRNINERRVLTLLRTEGRLSRAEIARRLSLTRSGVTYLVDNLLAQDLVAEAIGAPAPSRELGRPGVALSLNGPGHYFLGAEIGVRVLRLALADMRMEPARTTTIDLPQSPDPQTAIRFIRNFLNECERDRRFRGRIRAIGVTVPGLVRSDGFVLHLPILGWRDVNFLALAAESFGIPLSIENNANAAAFGEVYRNPKLSHDLVLFLKLGNGCGGAAIIDGRLLRGTTGVASEFGHMRVSDHGPRCHCGQTGCLETHVNLAALARYLAGAGAACSCDPSDVAAAVLAGDAAAIAAIGELRRHLATGMINLTNIFNPSDIVLGGAMRPVLELCLGELREAVAKGIVPGMRPPAIRLSGTSPFECAMGAAAISHHTQFDTTALSLGGAEPESMPPQRDD